ncbi:hypothetical protein NEMIN01_1193 [Nematocida minor]|uniref:uncharacterized protein n=1 Tax=Nematocida minor TaxID=1912983 RepID=UPI0022211EC9|nr:uncharacterized protein NEMIN01_1193 [Nematocida minor]KAI5190728.1 hypothetical protein NEMIN01_1193 [Nematocida minor]
MSSSQIIASEKEAFLKRVSCALDLAKKEKDAALDNETKEEIYKTISSPIHRAHESIVALVSIFIKPKTKTAWIIERKRELLEAVVVILKKVTFRSQALIFHTKEILAVINKRCTESQDAEEKINLLFSQIKIANEIPDDEHFRNIEAGAIGQLKSLLGLEWNFIGRPGYRYPGQQTSVPVLVCEVENASSLELNDTISDSSGNITSRLDEIEKALESGDRYYIFPVVLDTLKFYLSYNQKDLLYCLAKHFLLIGTEHTKSQASAVAHMLIREGYSDDAILIYAVSLPDRPLVTLSLVEYSITPENPLKEKEHELIWANALAATASHVLAVPLFQKHKETDQLIMSLVLAGKRDIARPLLQERIEKIKDELVMSELVSGTYSLHKPSAHSKEPGVLLKIEMASLLYALGCMDDSIDHLKEAFTLVKTAKYAKSLCTRLLLNGRHEEALKILQECKFEVLDIDTLLITAVSFAQSKKYADAERVLKYASIFNPKNERIDLALQNILMQQGKMEEAMDNLLQKIKTYTPNIAKDCNMLFMFAHSFMMFRYAESAIMALYLKTGQMPAEWMEKLLKSAEEHREAKEAYLSICTQVKSLGLIEGIRAALQYSPGVTAETEYYARKRVIEYSIHTREYNLAHEHLAKMKSLSGQIDQSQDYLDTVCAFYRSQEIR